MFVKFKCKRIFLTICYESFIVFNSEHNTEKKHTVFKCVCQLPKHHLPDPGCQSTR